MGKSCCENKGSELVALREKQSFVLKIVLVLNAVMFVVVFTAGLLARSSALTADSLDMLGDAIVYAFSLYVLHRSEKWKASAALLKGVIIVGFGVFVLASTTYRLLSDAMPLAHTMGAVGALALATNAACLALLWRHRADDLNLKSTFICSRNDIFSNCGVLVAAFLVQTLGSKWPDIITGYIIAGLFLRSAWPILLESTAALREKAVST